jgi:hypothetical protein
MELPYRGSGNVLYKGEKHRCHLYYSEKLGGIVIKVIVKNEKPIGDFLKFPLDIDYLIGQLDSGFHFTLLKLIRTRMQDLVSYSTSEYTFEARYILCGLGENQKEGFEPTFHKVEYVLSNIVEWGEKSAYTVGENYELIAKSDDIKKTLYESPFFNINYFVRGSFLPFTERDLLKEKIELEQHGIIEIEYNSEQNICSFDNIFERLKRLVEIASLRKINIERVYAYSKDIYYDIQDKTVERAIEIYGRNIKESEAQDPAQGRSGEWITLSELVQQHSFEKYFDKHDKLAPIVELFLEPFYVSDFSTSRIFLNVVQALETYHSRFITTKLDDFKLRVKTLVEELPEELQQKTESFLLAKSKSFITLESRIADLLLANWKIHFDTGEINRNDFPSVIAHTRNYYVHYDESIKQRERILEENELGIYNRALFKILEYYILIELGFSEDDAKITDKLKERWGNISQDLEILKLSRERSKTEKS